MADSLLGIAFLLSIFWAALIVLLIRDWLLHKPEAELPDYELPVQDEIPLNEDIPRITWWRDPRFWIIGVPTFLISWILVFLFWPVMAALVFESWWPRKPKSS